MCETVKVVVRCRPMNTKEKAMGCKNVVNMDPVCCTCYLSNPNEPTAPNKAFRFDGVYDESSATECIYNEVAYPLIEGVPEGYNCTIFAYGQTGCGKSFTMQGPREPTSQRGIIPRALEQLFEAAAVSEAKFLLTASFLEIHNEEIRDLLNAANRSRLELREHPERGVYVHELSSHPVHSKDQCVNLMERGWAARAVGATLMNTDSSRSHCIFCVNVERMDVLDDGSTAVRRGKLNLVDLAGSERQAKTGATGERLKEATKINLSLSALGNVISALVDGRTRHVPYRDSKLTRLLQDSLGGNTKTLMVACLSPADYNYDETLSTLRYAHRAKSIENKPRVNEDPKDAVIRQYQAEIEQLKVMLSGGQVFQNGGTGSSELDELRAKCEEEQRNKARLQQDLEELKSSYAQLSQLKVCRADVIDGSEDIKMTSPELIESSANPLQQAVLQRLQDLQSNMVGGELAHDTALKEKRQRQRKTSERRLKALATALGKKDDEEAAVLQIYDDIEQELAAKSDALRKARAKMRAFEREIKDLQREFETERTDYLETIRRQDKSLQLMQQITAKMAPLVKPECNYSDVERIKAEAVWIEDMQKWRLPEIMIGRTRLPPAGSTTPPKPPPQPPRAPSRTAPAKVGTSSSQPSSPERIPVMNGDTLMQKLEKGAQENFAANYFKPKRATELLIKAQEGNTGRQWIAQQWKESRKGGQFLATSLTSLSSSAGPTLEMAALANSNNSPIINHNNIAWAHDSSPELFMSRKPTRLEALPLLEKIGTRKRVKAELNTLDLL
ncbi:osmotic avoidance abnormal protein 3-like [Neocloeon triangulifer]|uniref:osmotic avoidance abnormal protein 3-like n=1 Tax=Neocloeon triangulifer TaxID=2078957 RepID=UPI00286F353F|nr:osmotic avoidance abnormal protein 3-like [Neocloeon triangulifer]XP_059468802.1 osmotic avoidance abnormal protein 3-like [Neocloeon triangulifer]